MRRRMVFAAGATLFAVALAACGTSDDGGDTNTRKSSTSASASASFAASSPPATPDNSELIAAARACKVVTKEMVTRAIPNSVATLLDESDGADPAYKNYEQRCAYTVRVGGQYNDNPDTPGSAFTIQIRTLVDEEGAAWDELKDAAGGNTDASEGFSQIFTYDSGAVGREVDGPVVVQIYSVDDTDGVVLHEDYAYIAAQAVDGLRAN